MADVKALFPIGKTQWSKWNDMQRNAFNALMEQGKSFPDAVTLANSMVDVFEQFEPKKHMKKNFFDVIEDVVETATDVAEAVATVAPVVATATAVAKTVARTRTKKGK